MSDILESAALILTVIGLLLSIWYNDIVAGLNYPKPFNLADSKPRINAINKALYQKSLPLTLLSGLFSLIFIPEVVNFLDQTIFLINQEIPRKYDAAGTAFCLVILTSLIITIVMVVISCRLWKKLKN
jgi:hypothetical protein